MNTAKQASNQQAISKRKVLGVFTRKNQKQYKHTNGQWYPVATTELVDFRTSFSEFLHCKVCVGFEWVTLPNNDFIIAYDGGRIQRTPVPAGTLVRRVSWGSPAMAGQVAVILP